MIQTRLSRLAIASAITLFVSSKGLYAQPHWPQFRGTDALGVADGAKLPESWDVATGKNIRWKAAVPGLGCSSPIAWGDKVFVTTAVGSGKRADELKVGLYGDPTSVYEKGAEYSWHILCLDRKTGKTLWDQESYRGVPKIRRHPKCSHANSTPVTDGKHVVAFFGSEGLYCYDLDGKLLWKKDFGVLDSGAYEDKELQWGFGTSPIIYDGKLVLQCDVQENSFLAVLDVKDGKEIWRVPRKDVCTWSTPAVVKSETGTQIVCNGYRHIGGYDFGDGRELWKLRGGGDVPVCTPIFFQNLIFITNAHGPLAPIYAIEPNAMGTIAKPSESASSRFMAWYVARGGNYMQTPIAYRDKIYFCRDNGVLTCYEPTSGEKIYQSRLGKGTTGFTASPVAADGRLYFTSEEGEVHVVEAGATFKELGTNPIGESSMSSPAIAGDLLLVRGQKHLFAIGTTPDKTGG